MKQKNKERRLQGRIKAWEAITGNKEAFKKPGSYH
jgi:hypothetical protein